MRVVVIGGSKGIGRAIADRLVADGHSIRRMARSFKGEFDSIENIWLDLSWEDNAITRQMILALEELGGIDWLIVSAGMSSYMAPWEETTAKAVEMMQVNFTGRMAAYRAVRRELLKANGHALFLSSTVVASGAKGLGLYAASLGALESWIRCEHLTMSKGGLHINALAPGWVNSEMTADLRPDYRKAAEEWMPLGRFLEPEEVAMQALRILQSELSGQIIEYLGD